MATDYLTLDQVCEALGSSQADVKAMVADGRLHEFRDAGKVFFKRAEIEKIAAKEGSSIVDLAADEIMVDTGEDNASFASALSSLADSSSSLGLGSISPGAAEPAADQPSELNLMDDSSPAVTAADSGSGSALGLSPMDMQAEDFPKDLPAAPKAPVAKSRELTSEIDLLPDSEDNIETAPPPMPAAASVPDLGLSGSSIISLEPGLDEAEAKPAPKPAAAPTGKGISVFEDEEVEIAADPMGETRISAGVDELEAVGSGSGLLDLTQVSDDTSLGAELLDVISPTEASETQADDGMPVVEAAETLEDEGSVVAQVDDEPMPTRAAASVATAGVAVAAAPRVAAMAGVEMPGTIWMNLTALLGVIGMIVVALVTAGSLQGVWPSFLTPLSKDVIHYSAFGGLGLLAMIFGVVGILAGRK